MFDTEPIVVCTIVGYAVQMSSSSGRKPSPSEEPFIKVRATFVFVKSGSEPVVYTESPIDISIIIGPYILINMIC